MWSWSERHTTSTPFGGPVSRASTSTRAAIGGRELSVSNLDKVFYSFEPDFFQQNLMRIVDDVVSVIKSSIQLWPALVEIAYFQKQRSGLPQIQVQNQRK